MAFYGDFMETDLETYPGDRWGGMTKGPNNFGHKEFWRIKSSSRVAYDSTAIANATIKILLD